MSGKKSKRDCGKDKSLGAPSPLPESCLATYREVFLATEFEKGGDEASVDAVKDGLINLFSKVTPTLSVIDDKSITGGKGRRHLHRSLHGNPAMQQCRVSEKKAEGQGGKEEGSCQDCKA